MHTKNAQRYNDVILMQRKKGGAAVLQRACAKQLACRVADIQRLYDVFIQV